MDRWRMLCSPRPVLCAVGERIKIDFSRIEQSSSQLPLSKQGNFDAAHSVGLLIEPNALAIFTQTLPWEHCLFLKPMICARARSVILSGVFATVIHFTITRSNYPKLHIRITHPLEVEMKKILKLRMISKNSHFRKIQYA